MTTVTLLFDLDDTLISNPQESFMPGYLKLLSARLSPHVGSQKMVPQLLYATDQMLQKDHPAQTLEEVFDDHFYSQLGIEKEAVRSEIEAFYSNEFNTLMHPSALRPAVLKIVDACAAKGHTLVVATNPLFPMIAMRSRLAWGGITQENTPFRYVSSYENVHFAKPNPAYYTEILGVLGWPHQPVGMIGNNLRDDILPFANLDYPAYWLDGHTEEIPENLRPLVTTGPIEDILPWVQSLEKMRIDLTPKSKSSILAVLKSTHAALQQLTRDFTEEDWSRRKPDVSFSILESVSHLLDVDAEINLPRFETILKNKNPFIPGVDSDAWINDREYNLNRTSTVFGEFLQTRTRLLHILMGLTNDDWLRPARHSIFGPTTLLELAGIVAVHDQDHLRQVCKVI